MTSAFGKTNTIDRRATVFRDISFMRESAHVWKTDNAYNIVKKSALELGAYKKGA